MSRMRACLWVIAAVVMSPLVSCASSTNGPTEWSIKCEYMPGCMKESSLQVYWTAEVSGDGHCSLETRRWDGISWISQATPFTISSERVADINSCVNSVQFGDLMARYRSASSQRVQQSSDTFVITRVEGNLEHRVAVSDPALILQGDRDEVRASDLRRFLLLLLTLMRSIPAPALPSQVSDIEALLGGSSDRVPSESSGMH